MKIIDLSNTAIETVILETCKVLENGGLVLFPTETTYGAGVDATNQTAVDKLLAYKSRREGKPLSILVHNKEMAQEYVEINEQASKLYSQFLPGPVTVVSKSLGTVAEGVASEFGTLGVRIPDYDLMLEISKSFKKPITATSANASGKKRPYAVADIFKNLSEKQKGLVDLVLDAGELPHNEPSTVIDTTLSTPVMLRSSDRAEHKQESQTNEHTTILTSNSEAETQAIAGRLLLQHWNSVSTTGIVIALDGDLGIGKTIFTKGLANFLKIEDTISSPTYSYIEEYDFTRHQTKGHLYHLDMWKVADKETFDRLEIATLLKSNSVIVIEWFSQIEEFIIPLLGTTKLIKINFTEDGQTRKLEIVE